MRRFRWESLRCTLEKEAFGGKKISQVKVSDAKLFLVKLQSDGKGYSSFHSIRGVLRSVFQMAVDDDVNVYCKYYEVVYILFHTGM